MARPPVRYSFTALTSMSDSSQVKPYVAHACPTVPASTSSRSSRPLGACAAIMESVNESFTKATATCRCSASPLEAERSARKGTGTNSSMFVQRPRVVAGRELARGSDAASASPWRGSPSQRGSTAADVSALSMISPAEASVSGSTRVSRRDPRRMTRGQALRSGKSGSGLSRRRQTCPARHRWPRPRRWSLHVRSSRRPTLCMAIAIEEGETSPRNSVRRRRHAQRPGSEREARSESR